MYVIKYEYYWYEEGCGCCTNSESTVEIYHNRLDAYKSSFNVPMMYDEDDLREYINDYHPEYNGFMVHPDTDWV